MVIIFYNYYRFTLISLITCFLQILFLSLQCIFYKKSLFCNFYVMEMCHKTMGLCSLGLTNTFVLVYYEFLSERSYFNILLYSKMLKRKAMCIPHIVRRISFYLKKLSYKINHSLFCIDLSTLQFFRNWSVYSAWSLIKY